MGDERSNERQRGDDVAEENPHDLPDLEASREGHHPNRGCHENFVRDGIYHGAQRRSTQSARNGAVEQVGGRRRSEYGHAPAGAGDQEECRGQRYSETADQVGPGPRGAALLASTTRTSFGHAAPLAERERARYPGLSCGSSLLRSRALLMILDTAVIPCGGLGTRLHPITRFLPKEVLPVALKPVLYWTLDEAADAGLLRAIIITNPHKPMLEAVARNYPGPLELEFVPQDHPERTG